MSIREITSTLEADLGNLWNLMQNIKALAEEHPEWNEKIHQTFLYPGEVIGSAELEMPWNSKMYLSEDLRFDLDAQAAIDSAPKDRGQTGWQKK